MARQRAAVAEGLAAALTLMGLFTSVDTLMDGESGALNELLPTTLKVAHMGADAAMDSFVTSEITASRKSFPARAARIRLGCWLGLGGA